MSKDAQRRRALASEVLAILAARFPLTFVLEGHRRPLKIGIDRDLASTVTGMSPRAIKDALRFYVGSQRYQEALVVGAERVDLAGAPVGIVSTEEAARASAAIELMVAQRIEANLTLREQKVATKQRETVAKTSPPAEAARAPDKPPIAAVPAPPVSARPRLTLQGLREAAQRRKAERER
jgi:ProP effector